MVQGSFKSKPKAGPVSVKKKNRAKILARENKKGEVVRNAKGLSIHRQNVSEVRATTQAINAKNETDVTARAMKAGKKFWLKDVSEAGAAELKAMNKKKVKKESKGDKLASRLKDKLAKLGKEL